MRINNLFPVGQMIGSVKNSGLVFWERNGNNFARANTRPSNPKSEDQVKIRNYLTSATKAWHLLSPAQRNGWQAYAEQYFTTDEQGRVVTPSGIATYMRANSIRQVLGLAIAPDAPILAPPAPLTEIAQVSVTAPDEVSFQITHSYSVLSGLSVIVRATPAMPTTAVKPRERDQRYIRGVSPDSATPLTATGTTLTFTPTKFDVGDGQRYGVEARIVRVADGIMSNPTFGDFIKIYT